MTYAAYIVKSAYSARDHPAQTMAYKNVYGDKELDVFPDVVRRLRPSPCETARHTHPR
jgi:hypothetical protein